MVPLTVLVLFICYLRTCSFKHRTLLFSGICASSGPTVQLLVDMWPPQGYAAFMPGCVWYPDGRGAKSYRLVPTPTSTESSAGENTLALPAQASDGAATLHPETPGGASLIPELPFAHDRPPVGTGVIVARQGWGGTDRAEPRAYAPVGREGGSQEPFPERW